MDTVDCLGSSGAGYTFEHAGRAYTMTHIDQGVKAAVEMWMRRREWALVREEKDILSEAEYAERVRETREKISRGFFSFAGDYCREMLNTLDGKLELIKHCFRKHHPDISDEDVLRLLVECPGKIEDGLACLHPKEYADAGLKKK